MRTPKEYINLLPRIERSLVRVSNAWMLGGGMLLIVWLGLFGMQAWQWWSAHEKLMALKPRQAALEQELAALRASLGLAGSAGSPQAALVQRLVRERVLWSEVFSQFSRIVPRGVWFDSLEGTSVGKPEIRIRGGAFNYRLISDFMLSLEQTDYFEKPELVFAQKAVVQGHDVAAFELRCGVKAAKGAH
ncbi:MAG TPA: PilN domain-containing protein [Nitrospirota bacterium]|nr:PilN domain-containing protein [Nitrospirota bacterium]